MAWQKIPKEHQPLLRAALPDDPRIEAKLMFGGLAAMVNGHMFAGLWADTALVRLGDADRAKVLAMPGGAPFDPMGRGSPMRDQVLLPAAELHAPARLRAWCAKALAYTLTLPPKTKGAKKAPAKKAPAKKKQ